MLPTTYYNWLSDRNWTWLGLRRLRPAPDRPYPWAALLIFPCFTAALLVALMAGISTLVRIDSSSQESGIHVAFFWIIGVFGFTASLVHRSFAGLSWNQRAARIRTSGQPEISVRPGALSRWVVGPFYLLLIGFVTPLAVLSAVENLRGALEWRSVRHQLIAQGEKLAIHELATKPGPEEQNFFGVAPFNRLLATPGSTDRIDTNAMAAFRVLELPRQVTQKRDPGDRLPPTLAEWAVLFRVAISNQNLPRGTKGYAAHGPRFPGSASNATDATVVRTALSPTEPLLRQFCEATLRPQAVFPVRWDDGFNAILPHLAKLKSLQTLIDVRVAAFLANHEPDRAFADAECALRFAAILRNEPLLISQLVRYSQANLAAQTVWRGLEAHAWNDSQLEALQQQLSSSAYLTSLLFAFEGERALALSSMEGWAQKSRLFWTSAPFLGAPETDQLNSGSFSLMPVGWIRQNQASLARFYQDLIANTRKLATPPGSPGQESALKGVIRAQVEPQVARSRSTPYNLLTAMLVPAMERAAIKAIRAEVTYRCAATGCALERYRLQHAAYPETLAALVPEYLKTVPLDPINHEPLHYARTADGLFRLWSVGANGTDEGGIYRRDHKDSSNGLDWTWPYQMP